MPFDEWNTGDVWRWLQAALSRRELLGATPQGGNVSTSAVLAQVNGAMSYAWQVVQLIDAGLQAPVRALSYAASQLQAAYFAALQAGWTTIAQAISVLSSRVGQALNDILSGAGSGMAAMLGATPAQLVGGLGVLALAGVAGVVIIASGAGGQAALVTLAARRVTI